MKKKLACLLIAVAMVMGFSQQSTAIEFKAKGQWTIGFDLGNPYLLHSAKTKGVTTKKNLFDNFTAAQRIRLTLDAIASENLSASVMFQIGLQQWGKNAQGAALGADGKEVKVRWGYIDWKIPDTQIKTRMGIQYIRLPNKAGGPAVFANRVGAITVSSPINENLGLTAFWMRPFNDNFTGETRGNDTNYRANYLDNMDLFGMTIPVKLDGFEVTPWAMYGMRGKNAQWTKNSTTGKLALTRLATASYPNYTLFPYMGMMDRKDNGYTNNSTSKAYGSLFWAGLPIQVTALDPINIEFDFNYGYVEAMGRYNVWKGAQTAANLRRASTQRQGWLAKALAEYKMDWGTPGIFGWYGSGDDGNPKNGSERMPSISAYGDFTSFIGDSFFTLGDWHDMAMDYSGTWGIGLRLKDMTFFSDKVKNTFRVAWWGGTNSPSNIKYMSSASSWSDGIFKFAGPYLTTKDGLLEFNLITDYKIYENLLIQLDMGYIANYIDNKAWEKAGAHDSTFSKQDAWKAQINFHYSF